jgi:hypothetical protein
MYLVRPYQINFGVPVLHHFYPQAKNGIFPIAWRNETQAINSTQADEFKTKVNGVKSGSIASYILGPVIGVALLVVGFILFAKQKKYSSNEKSSKFWTMPFAEQCSQVSHWTWKTSRPTTKKGDEQKLNVFISTPINITWHPTCQPDTKPKKATPANFLEFQTRSRMTGKHRF